MEAFADGAGFSAERLRMLIIGLVVLMLALWFVWALQGNFKLFTRGDSDQFDFMQNVAFALAVFAMVLVFIGVNV